MDCEYTKVFPVDQWNRLGGSFSLSDVPIAGYQELTREGTVLSEDIAMQTYEVSDYEKGWVFEVPMKDVKIVEGEEDEPYEHK